MHTPHPHQPANHSLKPTKPHKAGLDYPQSKESARRLAIRRHGSLRQFAKENGVDYQAIREVLNRADLAKVNRGKVLRAGIALGLVPEHEGQCASPVPAEQALHAFNLKLAELLVHGVKLTQVEYEAKPLPIVKVFPHPFLEDLKNSDTKPVWVIREQGTTWKEWNVVWRGCLLIWMDETADDTAEQEE